MRGHKQHGDLISLPHFLSWQGSTLFTSVLSKSIISNVKRWGGDLLRHTDTHTHTCTPAGLRERPDPSPPPHTHTHTHTHLNFWYKHIEKIDYACTKYHLL